MNKEEVKNIKCKRCNSKETIILEDGEFPTFLEILKGKIGLQYRTRTITCEKCGQIEVKKI